MDGVTWTSSVLPRSASALAKAAQAAFTDEPMAKAATGIRPLVPPMATREPLVSRSSGQAARASRTHCETKP
jgi:hypothetical protein